MKLAESLLRVKDLHAVDPAMIGLLSVAGDEVRIPSASDLLVEGRVSHMCFLLVEGQVELFLDRPPQRHVLRMVEAGEFFGHDAVLCRDPQRWSSRTLGPATLLRFDSGTLESTLERGGPLSMLIHERLAVSAARQLRDANALLLRAEPAVELAGDTEAYIARTAARAGVTAEVLEMRVQAVPDLGSGWKRR